MKIEQVGKHTDCLYLLERHVHYLFVNLFVPWIQLRGRLVLQCIMQYSRPVPPAWWRREFGLAWPRFLAPESRASYPIFGKKPDPGLCTSNIGKFHKLYCKLFDNFKRLFMF